MTREIASLDDALTVARESVGSLWERSRALSLVVRYADIEARKARREGRDPAEYEAISADAERAQDAEIELARGAA